MKWAKNFLTVVTMIATIGLAAGATQAATFFSSATPPAVDGSDIASFGTPTTTGWPTEDKWWPGSATAFGSPGKTIGQTFTTGSDDVVLNAFTFQIKNATEPTKEYAIRVGTVSGSTFTEIASESATQSVATAADGYWTWTLDSPVSLSANTVYGVDVGLLSSTSSWQTGIPYVYRTADVYPDGTRFRSGTAGSGVGDSSMSDMSVDRVFHIDLEALAQDGALHIFKFFDENGNGEMDGNEQPLPPGMFTFLITDPTGQQIEVPNCEEITLPAGIYTGEEIPWGDWYPTTPAPFQFEILPGEVTEVFVGNAVPEPATMALCALAACGLGGYVRRRRNA